MSNIAYKLKEFTADLLQISEDSISDEQTFMDDLRMDSLQITELVSQVEEEFEIEIPDEDLQNIQTVREAVAYLEGRLA